MVGEVGPNIERWPIYASREVGTTHMNKSEFLHIRIESRILKSLKTAARLKGQSFSRFMVEAGRTAVFAAIRKGSKQQPPPRVRDARRK
jgi:hypothetical protein